jgi:hypothetical protein
MRPRPLVVVLIELVHRLRARREACARPHDASIVPVAAPLLTASLLRCAATGRTIHRPNRRTAHGRHGVRPAQATRGVDRGIRW